MTQAQLIVLIVGSIITAIPTLLFLFRFPFSPLHALAVCIAHNAPGPRSARFRIFAELGNGFTDNKWKKYGIAGITALVFAAITVILFFTIK